MRFTPRGRGLLQPWPLSLHPPGLCPPLLSLCLLHTKLPRGREEQPGARAEPESRWQGPQRIFSLCLALGRAGCQAWWDSNL